MLLGSPRNKWLDGLRMLKRLILECNQDDIFSIEMKLRGGKVLSDTYNPFVNYDFGKTEGEVKKKRALQRIIRRPATGDRFLIL